MGRDVFVRIVCVLWASFGFPSGFLTRNVCLETERVKYKNNYEHLLVKIIMSACL